MREIKFRAFNKNTGVILKNVPVCNGSAMTWRIAPKDSPVIILEGKDGSTQFCCDWDFLKEDPFLIVEQFTGLKDANGVEIFEGDIVESSIFICPLAVYYNEDLAMYRLTAGGNSDDGDFIQYEGGAFKVIGNIHQNPDLLK